MDLLDKKRTLRNLLGQGTVNRSDAMSEEIAWKELVPFRVEYLFIQHTINIQSVLILCLKLVMYQWMQKT